MSDIIEKLADAIAISMYGPRPGRYVSRPKYTEAAFAVLKVIGENENDLSAPDARISRMAQQMQGRLLGMEDGCFAKGKTSDLCRFPPCACMIEAAKVAVQVMREGQAMDSVIRKADTEAPETPAERSRD